MNRYFVFGIAAALVGCRDRTPSPTSRTAVVRQPAVITDTVRADSARAFVQRFYVWYLATEAQQGSTYDSLLTARRSFLGDSLLKALDADIAAQRADTIPEIASLSAEADVFLNSQDPCPRYTAGAPRPLEGGRFAVLVVGNCNDLETKPNIEVVLRPVGVGWQIENIKDPTNPSYDLTGALVRYHTQDGSAAAADSVRSDSSRNGTA
jgi:hypothetical protein